MPSRLDLILAGGQLCGLLCLLLLGPHPHVHCQPEQLQLGTSKTAAPLQPLMANSSVKRRCAHSTGRWCKGFLAQEVRGDTDTG